MNNAEEGTQMNTYFVNATVYAGYGSNETSEVIKLMVIAKNTREFIAQLTRYTEKMRTGLVGPRIDLPREVVRQVGRLRPDNEIEGVEVVEGVLEYPDEIRTVTDSHTLFTDVLEGDIDEVINALNEEREEVKKKYPTARRMSLRTYTPDNEWSIEFERDEHPFESQIRITAKKLRQAAAAYEAEFERLLRELGKD